MEELPGLSLYMHFPWCVAKCPYCDFNSHTLRGMLPSAQYVDALIAELERESELVAGRPVSSIFLGGGTPSLFAPEDIARIMEAVHRYLEPLPDMEVTLEANPGTVEHGRFAGYRGAGVNRLSLGAQSFNDGALRRLGRIHDSGAIRNAFAEARAAGFDNINLDLMYGLPEQTIAEAEADIRAALGLRPEHLSHYQLTIEKNTVFYARRPALPDDDTCWSMFEGCAARLAAAGFKRYEVSAWAQPGRHCGHNLNYWTYGDYLGLGAGAHSKLTLRPGRVQRMQRPANPRDWLRSAADPDYRVPGAFVGPEDAVFEFMLNGLRLLDGIRLTDFERRTGLASARLQPLLGEACTRGLMERVDAGLWRPTDLGNRFLDDLQSLFLPSEAG